MTDKSEIILYQPNEELSLEVRLENETVWLNRQQLSILFGRDVKTIGKHVQNALKEELSGVSTVAEFATVQNEDTRLVTREIEYYNLDVVLSVGYRVKSSRGVEFRRWANKVLKEYLLQGYAINQRIERLEQRMSNTENKIEFFVRTSLPPTEGVFYDGQIFDAFAFFNNLVRSAKKRIVLIDNYIDDSVLLRLAERQENVSATIYTKQTSPSFNEALQQHNQQYPQIEVVKFKKSHDRFLITDDEVYHIGASIKDLGKKWFAFCKLETPADELLSKLNI